MTFCEMHKKSGCAECPNRYACRNSTIKEEAPMFEQYKPFMPETPIEGRMGFYPCTQNEWKSLPLPLRCATWFRRDIEAVIFDAWLDNYRFRANVEVHPEYAFKAVFSQSYGGTQLYSIVGIRTTDGKRIGAKWLQDTASGAFAIFAGGDCIAKQGGYKAHMPEICQEKSGGGWELAPPSKEAMSISRYHLV